MNNVKLCKKTGGSITDVVEQVAEDYGFSEEKASAYVEKYWWDKIGCVAIWFF